MELFCNKGEKLTIHKKDREKWNVKIWSKIITGHDEQKQSSKFGLDCNDQQDYSTEIIKEIYVNGKILENLSRSITA